MAYMILILMFGDMVWATEVGFVILLHLQWELQEQPVAEFSTIRVCYIINTVWIIALAPPRQKSALSQGAQVYMNIKVAHQIIKRKLLIMPLLRQTQLLL